MVEQEKREMVKRGLECCLAEDKRSSFCHKYDCPYRDYEECPMNLMRDALDLLKAQEPVKPYEYDPVIYGTRYTCGKCRHKIFRNVNYCSNCGTEVKWDE